MKKADIDSILKENQSLKKRNQELENLLQGTPGPVPVSQEQIYRSLLHLCPASLTVTSLDDGVIYEVSDRFCRQSGFTREELIGRSTVERGFWIAPDEGRKKFREMLLRDGQCVNQEFRYRRRHGEVITGLTSAVLIQVENRRYAIVLVMDITDQKRVEEAVQESENRYRFLAEHMTDIAWITDMNLKTLYITPSITKVLGYTPRERSRLSLDRKVTPDSVSRVRETLARLIAYEAQGKRVAEKPVTLLLEFYHRDGSTRWMETIVQGFHNARGDLTLLHGVSRDVTSRRRFEEALIQEQVCMRSIIDSFPGIFCMIDEQARYILWNKNYEEVTGFSDEEIRTMTVLNVPPASDRKVMAEEMRYAFEHGAFSHEHGLVCKDGTVKDYLFNVARIDYQGRPCLMVNGVDISEQKQIQNDLRHLAEDLADANTALRIVLRERKEEQKAIEEKLQANINDLVMPYLKKIGRVIQEDPYKQYLSVLESNLKEIVSPFMKHFLSFYKYLTPQEIQVADLIRKGKRTKEIADMLHTSASTIGTHRNHIRKKLNLKKEGINLRTYLQSLH